MRNTKLRIGAKSTISGHKPVKTAAKTPQTSVAGFKSEVLVLGAYSEEKGVVLLTPTDSVENGSLVG